MQFSRIISFVDLQIWNATSNGFSFVTTESSDDHGLQCDVPAWSPVRESNRGNIDDCLTMPAGASPCMTSAP